MAIVDLPGERELYEFGPFTVDPGKELLLRGDEPVALTPKAFQILMVLIRHGQEVVTKDDLMKAVWPDTFVEEGNLSRNVFLLRKALGESPTDRFIVTVPGRGYRLTEPVRAVVEAPAQDRAAEAAIHNGEAEAPDHLGADIAIATRTRMRVDVEPGRWPGWMTATAAAVTMIAVSGIAVVLWNRRPPPRLTDKDTVVIADFTNATGDPVFDETLRQGTAVQIEQSPMLRIVSDQRIRQTRRLMRTPDDVRLTGEVARDVCERAGAAAVLQGSVEALGTGYVLGLEARSCRTADVLADEQAQAASKQEVLGVLSDMVRRLRARIGESLASVEQHSTRLDEATTSSLDALKVYTAGWQAHAARGAAAAMPLFQRAIEIDPGFAMAHASLGRIYADLDQPDRAAESMARAWELRDRTSEPERYFVTANYQLLVAGNIDAGRTTCEAWARTYPRDARPHATLAGMIHKTAARFDAALREAQLGVAADPDFGIGYYSVGVNNQYLGRLDAAQAALDAAAARGLDIDEFLMLAYELAFLKGDTARLEQIAASARARPGGETWMSAREALVAAYAGHLQSARALTDRAVAQAKQAGQPERAALWEAGAAVREGMFGEVKESERRAEAALALSRNRETEYSAALAFAKARDTARAQALVQDLETRFPEDSSIQFSALPVLRAQLALNRRDPAQALEALQLASPHELGVPRSTVSALFGAMYPVYLRGEAYLALHRGDDAAAEFQKIVDRPTIVVSDPIGALARLQLGRAYALAGDRARAESEYRAFLTLWRDADPTIPVLHDAHAELARLQ